MTKNNGGYSFSFSLQEEEEVALSIRAKLNETDIGERKLTVSEKN